MSFEISKDPANSADTIRLQPVRKATLEAVRQELDAVQRRWLDASSFSAEAGKVLLLPAADGGIETVLFGQADQGWLYQLAAIQSLLPAGRYWLSADWTAEQMQQAYLGWGLAAYRFERYRKNGKASPILLLPADLAEDVQALLAAQCLVRDLVNTPTEHLGPGELSDAIQAVADEFDASIKVVQGEDLLTQNFPAIHAVGRASHRPPRLIELDWGETDNPLLVLVGKGVCFDTGGLDLKNASGMALMKKDMGGAAHALALARLVMLQRLPVRLKLLVPAVENAVAGNAYRPGDVIPTRKGSHIEIGNTDAEGRVILSDALALACEASPDLVVDFATLTGAARVALGTDLPALFSNRPELGRAIEAAGEAVEDPLWMMPLYQPYKDLIKSSIADLNNTGKTSFGGCITAALFLEHFVTADTPWVHIDTFAWNSTARPGRPEGGEALGLRALHRFLQQRYPGSD